MNIYATGLQAVCSPVAPCFYPRGIRRRTILRAKIEFLQRINNYFILLKYMKMKKYCVFFLSVFIFLSTAFSAEQKAEGRELSDAVYTALSEKKFQAERIPLSRTAGSRFPYNILIQIPGIFEESGGQDSPPREFNTVLVTFTQEDIENRMDFLSSLLEDSKSEKYPFNIQILLTACDRQELPGNEGLTGTAAYSSLIEGTEDICALRINLDSKKGNSITPGADKKLCPLWLVKTASHSFEKCSVPASITGGVFMSLHKLGIFRPSEKLPSYLNKNIPALELNLAEEISNENLHAVLKTFFEEFGALSHFESDLHYIPVSISGTHYWIGEHTTIIFLMLLTVVSLALFCDLGFVFRKKHSLKTLNVKRALHSFYIVPSTIVLLAVCLQLGQYAASFFFKLRLRNPAGILGIKFIVSIILVSLLYLLEVKIRRRRFSYVYEYMLLFSSLLNVFVFSAIDISLFYFFALIYFIIFISRFFKKTAAVYAFFILSFIPYFALISCIVMYSSPRQIYQMLFGTMLSNVLLSCAITPLCLILLRIYILVANNSARKTHTARTAPDGGSSPAKQKKVKRYFSKHYILIQILTVTLSVLFILLVHYEFKNQIFKTVEFNRRPAAVADVPEAHFLNVRCSDSNYYGGTIRTIYIDTQKKAQRVEVFVSGQTENPVFYTAYMYSQTEQFNQVQFDLPDCPPEKFQIEYTPDNSTESTVEIRAYYGKDSYPEELIPASESSGRRNIFARETVSVQISRSAFEEKSGT